MRRPATHLGGGHIDLPLIDLALDLARVLAVNGAPDRHGSAQHLLDCPREGLGARALGHHARNLVDIIDAEVTSVLDVLLLRKMQGKTLSSRNAAFTAQTIKQARGALSPP